jgi:hypothetical protein
VTFQPVLPEDEFVELSLTLHELVDSNNQSVTTLNPVLLFITHTPKQPFKMAVGLAKSDEPLFISS